MVTPSRIGLLIFDEISSVELTGAAEAFSRAAMPYGYGCCEDPCHKVKTLGVTTAQITTDSGPTVIPEVALTRASFSLKESARS